MILFESRNCQGLANRDKRLDLLNELKSERIHVACFQDIHLEKWEIPILRKEWNAEVIASTKSSQSRGVAVLISTNVEFTIHNKIVDHQGNFILLDISISGLPRRSLANFYGPNKDNPDLF